MKGVGSRHLIAGCSSLLLVISSGMLPEAAWAGSDSSHGQSYYAGLSCDKLWYERNKIFADAGYCFNSERGIAAFGNRCYPPYGELPAHKREVVREIRHYESVKGC